MDIDWDDDDEKTAIFDKHIAEEALRPRKAPAPAAGAPMPPLPSVPPSLASAPAGFRPSAPPLPAPTPSPAPPPPPGMAPGRSSAVPPPPPPTLPQPFGIPSMRPAGPSHAPSGPPAPPSLKPVVSAPPISRPAPSLAPSIPSFDDRPLRSRKLSPSALITVGAALVVLIAISVFLFLPRQGGLVVAVAGPGKKQVDTVQVFVDNEKKCDTSPCVVRDLSAGTAHIVKIKAAGYASPADQPVSIKAGEDVVVNIDLTPSSGGPGLKVTAAGSGLKLWVDGKEIGALPQEVKDITPGEHTIKVGGNDRYETYEEKVTVPSDEQKAIGPLKLKVLRGVANIEPGSNADGAKVMLVSGSEKRALTKLPTRIDIATDKEWKLVATKKGYTEFQTPLSFDTGEAERTFKIDLYKGSQEEAEEAPRAAAHRPVSAPPVTHKKPAEPITSAPKTATAKPAAGQGTLNVNSIPVSNVIVDGRPMGSTPKMGLSVAAGTHTVVFVHPEHGRKVVTVNVNAGQAATAATRFP